MINLIPPEGKRTIKHEYWARMCTVWGWLFVFVLVVTSLLLVPSYVLVHSQLKAISLEAERTRQGNEALLEEERTVRDINKTIEQLQIEETETPLSEVIKAVDSSVGPGINIARYQISREKAGIQSISINGVASTREELVAFRNDLERSAYFETAHVPISDLARDVDLPFAITITLSK